MARVPVEAKPNVPDFVYDPINERVVIGAAIAADKTQRRVLVHMIGADEFMVPANAAVWRSLRIIVDRALDYDGEVLRRLVRDELGEEYDDKLIATLEADATVPDASTLKWHTETMRWDATRARVLKGALPELLTSIQDAKASPESVASSARAVHRALDGGTARRHIHRPEELARTYKASIAGRRAVRNFFPMGYAAIDEHLTEGAMPGKVCVLVGLSGSGKSTFACDFALQQARIKRRVLMCAWEMGAMATLDVMVAQMCQIPIDAVVQGGYDTPTQRRIERAVDWITSRITFMENAFFDEAIRKGGGNGRGFKSNDRALDTFEGYVAESGCQVVVADLWERMLIDLSYDGVTTALYRQQAMVREFGFYLMLVHQLKLKDVEKRQDKRPTREAIKGTGAYVEVADKVIGIHRDAQFRNVPDDALEAICMKQRMGKANWAVRFHWEGEMGRITNGVTVPYNPGLDDDEENGNFDDIKTGRGRGGRKRRDG